ncbi:MAG: hypothetical protein K5681_01045 [Treponema sp.]|nr:hypothetical protein [Treponema sp.]
MYRWKRFILFFSLISFFSLFAEELPNGYKDIILGMNLEETKDALVKDPDFGYHGDRDVSLLPGGTRELIETDARTGHGSNFLEQCYFQFFMDELYIITININPQRMDYYSIFTKLTEKYGQPDSFDPNSASWKNDDVTMSLERPLTLKYIDNEIYKNTQNYNNVPLSPTERTKEMFLDEL